MVTHPSSAATNSSASHSKGTITSSPSTVPQKSLERSPWVSTVAAKPSSCASRRRREDADVRDNNFRGELHVTTQGLEVNRALCLP